MKQSLCLGAWWPEGRSSSSVFQSLPSCSWSACQMAVNRKDGYRGELSLWWFLQQTITQESPSFTVGFTPWYKQTGLKSNSCGLHLITFCWPSTGIPVPLGEKREKQDFHTVLLKIQSVADWLHQTFVHPSDLISKWKKYAAINLKPKAPHYIRLNCSC